MELEDRVYESMHKKDGCSMEPLGPDSWVITMHVQSSESNASRLGLSKFGACARSPKLKDKLAPNPSIPRAHNPAWSKQGSLILNLNKPKQTK